MIANGHNFYFKSCHATIIPDPVTLIIHVRLKRLNNYPTPISTLYFEVGSGAIDSFAFQERKF